MVSNQLVFAFALDRASASSTALLFGTFPIFVALVASAVGTEKLRSRHWAATLVSFGGVALVAVGAGGGSFDGGIVGVLLGLGIAVTWAGYSVGVKPLLARYSAYRVSAWVMIIGAVPLALVAVAHLLGQNWGAITALAWGAFAYTTVIGLVLANVTYFTSIERVGAARASLYLNLQPFLGALMAVAILSEERKIPANTLFCLSVPTLIPTQTAGRYGTLRAFLGVHELGEAGGFGDVHAVADHRLERRGAA